MCEFIRFKYVPVQPLVADTAGLHVFTGIHSGAFGYQCPYILVCAHMCEIVRLWSIYDVNLANYHVCLRVMPSGLGASGNLSPCPVMVDIPN
jgi:hypothetical protein